MTVVYVDSVFTLNALVDYLLLLGTARLAGIPLRRGRYLMAALLGGTYAVGCFLPGGGFLAQTPVKAAAGIALALVAFGGEERLLRLTVLLFAVSCAMAGGVLGVGLLSGGAIPAVNGIFYTDIDARVLLVTATAAYLLLSLVFRAAAAHGVAGELLDVRLSLGGRSVELTALHDTGNSLRDPLTGQQVLVLSRAAAAELLGGAAAELLREKEDPLELLSALRRLSPGLKPRLIPYSAVGTPQGLMLAFRADWARIGGGIERELTVGVSPTEMEVSALWGGMVRKGDGNDRAFYAAAALHPAGTAGAPGRALHRRERHPAAAPIPGAGGGAHRAHHGGGRPEGTDRT